MLINLMTRIPEPGLTKKRLETHFSKEECTLLHCAFIKDMMAALEQQCANYQVVYDPKGNLVNLARLFAKQIKLVPQKGTSLGEKMLNAMVWGFEQGNAKVALLGTDIPTIEPETIQKADDLLDSYDVVLGPAVDGGYYLIGMKYLYKDLFSLEKWGHGAVLQQTIQILDNLGLTWTLLPQYRDIDCFSDVQQLWQELKRPDLKHKPHYTYNLLKALNMEARWNSQ